MTEPSHSFIDADPGPESDPWDGVTPDSPAVENPWQPINLATLPEHPPVQPTLGNVGIVYPGKRHVFSGPQESAKTLAAYAVGLQVVRDRGILILIDFEMGAWDARNRLQELGATNEEFASIHYLEPTEPATDATMPRLLALDPNLVIVDAAAGAYDLQGLDDTKRSDVEKFTRLYVRAFWKAEVATIVLDHVVKDAENRGKYAIGSERKVGGADVHLGFEAITPIHRGGKGLYKIVTHKDRGGYLKRGTLANLELHSDPGTHTIEWAFIPSTDPVKESDWRPTKLMEKVSAYLELHSDTNPSRTKIEEEVVGKAEYVRRAIDYLIEDGFAEEVAGPRNARLVALITSYRESKEEESPRPTPSPPRPDGVAPRPGTPNHTMPSTPLRGGGDGVTQAELPSRDSVPTEEEQMSAQSAHLETEETLENNTLETYDQDIPF